MNCFGDSITFGYGVTAPANAYVNKLAAQYSLNTLNYALSANMAADQCGYTYTSCANEINIIAVGANDTATYGNSSIKSDAFIKFVRTIGVMNSGCVIVKAKNMTKNGSWTDQNGSLGCYTQTNGDYLTASVKGTTVYVGRFLHTAANSQFEVWIDGVLVDTVIDNGTTVGATAIGTQFATATNAYTGLTNTVHTIRLVSKSTTIFMPEYIAGSDVPNFVKPLFIANVMKKVAYNTGDSQGNAQNYGALLSTLVAEFNSSGLKAYLVDLYSALNTATDYFDNIHPNDAGHVKIYNTFKTAIDSYIASLNTGTPLPCAPLNGIVNYPVTNAAVTYVSGAVTQIKCT